MKRSVILAVVGILFAMSNTACSNDEPTQSANGTITFKYTIPEETFKYIELEACWNNNEMAYMLHTPVLDPVFTSQST